ncbi:MAG TPA: C1 family peptidase [Xylanibacter oryzae]|nr:C1 family peptidase [Xylanibacter oryzae]
MKKNICLLIFCTTVLFTGCVQKKYNADRFTVETINRYTPVKNQGFSSDCWAYAMLATIESEHIERGDSVNLSVAYVMRMRLKDEFRRYYLSGGHIWFTERGMGQTLINTIETYGAMPYDSYQDKDGFRSGVLCNKLKYIADNAIGRKSGLKYTDNIVESNLDDLLGPAPLHVYMLGAEYTPLEFAHSVCGKDEYVALTSYTHHPFYQQFALEVQDNWEQNQQMNLPLDSMENMVIKALRHHHSVCWEGDTSEPGFSFVSGVARLQNENKVVTQKDRQNSFEKFLTTDDHCMEILGLAHDRYGKRYFICKNSWGTDNPYKGLMYMSENYFRLKTIAVYLVKNGNSN